MARKKVKKAIKFARPLANKSDNYLSQIKWGESYTSLFLGAIVVVVALVLVFSFFKSRNVNNQATESTQTTAKEQAYENGVPKSYTVKKGDDLWNISEKIYGSGYNWVDIAKENKLENPGILYVGTKLSVPNVSPKTVTVVKEMKSGQANLITGASYKVLEGDYLWDIALRAYGDGYKWVEIARANKIINPNIIHPGNVFRLPR